MFLYMFEAFQQAGKKTTLFLKKSWRMSVSHAYLKTDEHYISIKNVN